MERRKIDKNLHRTVKDARLVTTPLPLVPEISLYLLSEDYPRGQLEHDEMMAIMNQPAYWAFCWASGQVLARYILDHAQRFREKTVLDLGTGSGVVA
ncbi:MAG TPA: methyltransferase type 12, partial [Pseudomonadales bacterium]|nr:methyltransferase type 12 [Pseudomonadales bacterium]